MLFAFADGKEPMLGKEGEFDEGDDTEVFVDAALPNGGVVVEVDAGLEIEGDCEGEGEGEAGAPEENAAAFDKEDNPVVNWAKLDKLPAGLVRFEMLEIFDD